MDQAGQYNVVVFLYIKANSVDPDQLLLKEQSDLRARGLTKMFLNHFSR